MDKTSNIDLDSLPEIEDIRPSGFDYPADWYARKDSLYKMGNSLFGNWGRPAGSSCKRYHSKHFEMRYIKSLRLTGDKCEDGEPIVQVILRLD